MAEFVKIELMFHAKALEMYTQCYQSLRTQSQQDDLQVSSSLFFPHFYGLLYMSWSALAVIEAYKSISHPIDSM